MTPKRLLTILALVVLLFSLVALAPLGLPGKARAVPASAAPANLSKYAGCTPVGGVLMTNVNAISGTTPQVNLGPVFGDLAGSVAAEPLSGAVGYHHYWVTSTGDSIYFADALLHADAEDALDGGTVIAVRWGHYGSDIVGGTGKFEGAKGHLDYFGLVDFNDTDAGTHQPGKTLVLRYRGEVCYAH